MKTQFTILAFIIGISLTNAQETEKPIQKNQFNFMEISAHSILPMKIMITHLDIKEI